MTTINETLSPMKPHGPFNGKFHLKTIWEGVESRGGNIDLAAVVDPVSNNKTSASSRKVTLQP